jgi:Transposase protein
MNLQEESYELKKIKKEMEALKSEKSAWRKRVLVLQGKNKKLRTQNSTLRKEKVKSNAEIKNLKKNVKKQNIEITKAHLARAQLYEKIHEAKGAISKKARESIIREAVKGFLSKAQVDRILLGKSTHWSPDDIMSSTVLLSHSSRAYRCLREDMKYPLPAVSTLKAHVSKLPVEAGLLKSALILMKARAKCMTPLQKIASVSFDEMHNSKEWALDEKGDCVVGGKSKTQVIMARGLFSPWKSPVYFNHNQPVTEELLDLVITALHEAGFVVATVVSDMGTENQKLYTDMGVSEDHPYFLNPVTGENICCFHDAPHLLKLARNHLVDQGFILNPSLPKTRQEVACVEPLQQLIKIIPGRDVPIHKVTQHHLTCEGCDRQIVRLATQVLSQKTAVALQEAGKEKLIKSLHYLVINTIYSQQK